MTTQTVKRKKDKIRGANRAELVESMLKAGLCGDKKVDCERALTSVLQAIEGGLKRKGAVSLVGFGTFLVRHREARTVIPPGQTEPKKIKASKTVGFKCGKALKEKMNKG